MAEHSEEIAQVDDGLCSCGHHVLDHGYLDDGNGWEASPCRLCTCLDSDWGEPSLSFRDEARVALGRALDESLLRSEEAAEADLSGSKEIVQRLFVSRPQYVEAVPWDGSNVAEVLAAIPDKTRYDRTTARMFLLAGGPWQQEWVPVPDGYWLVHPPGDLTDVWPVEDAFFQAKYEPVLFGSSEVDRG